MPNVELADDTVARLQTIAIPLTDTFDSVILRLLDSYEASALAKNKVFKAGEPIALIDGGLVMKFDPASPPNLRFTTCSRITVNGKPIPKGLTNWNGFLIEMVRAVYKKVAGPEAMCATMTVANAVVGKREDSGYKFISDVGISIQGQDASAAFKQIYILSAVSGVKFTVAFEWQNNEKAVYAGRRGYLEV